jgi:uncharacterized protein YjbI with pentapeptide repeats
MSTIEDRLKAHAAWRRGDAGGVQLVEHGDGLRGADLAGADLFGADLSGADLTGANLIGADLLWADLRACTGLSRVSVSWDTSAGEGELLAIHMDGEPHVWCDDFCGTVAELREYIANHDPELAAGRRKVLDLALDLLAARQGVDNE